MLLRKEEKYSAQCTVQIQWLDAGRRMHVCCLYSYSALAVCKYVSRHAKETGKSTSRRQVLREPCKWKNHDRSATRVHGETQGNKGGLAVCSGRDSAWATESTQYCALMQGLPPIRQPANWPLGQRQLARMLNSSRKLAGVRAKRGLGSTHFVHRCRHIWHSSASPAPAHCPGTMLRGW